LEGGKCLFGSMRNSGDSSSEVCKLEHRDYYRALTRPHSWARSTSVEPEKLDTPQTYGSSVGSKYSPPLGTVLG